MSDTAGTIVSSALPLSAFPPSPGYTAAVSSFNLLPSIAPSAATVVRSIRESVDAVRAAASARLGISISTTGHAAAGMGDLTGTLLVRPQFETPVTVDAGRRVAIIPAGANWGDVVRAAEVHGLAAMHGSSPTVGAIGYLLRGGLSFYGRRRGLAANSLLSITLVTATGDVVRTDPTTDPDLFWAIRGGGGGFGIVVEVEIELFPMWRVLTGFTAWDARDADRIAPLWRDWTESASPEVTTSLRLMNLPALPEVPEALRYGQMLVLDGAIGVETPADLVFATDVAEALLAPLRSNVTPIMDTWHAGPPSDLAATHLDPLAPMPYVSDHFLIDHFDDGGIALWASTAGEGSGSVLAAAELRQLGGAFARPGGDGGALDRIGGQFAAFNLGVPVGDVTPELIAAQQRRIRSSLGYYDTGYTVPTFVETRDSRHRSLASREQERVDQIRRRLDPTGVFERDVIRATIR